MNILITGTSRGLGLLLSEHFLKRGHTVFGCSSSGKNSIKHSNYQYFKVDVRSESDIKKMVMNIKKKSGSLDVVINNAGVASMNHFLTAPLSTAQKIMDINCLGTFLVTRETAKLMKKNKRGRVINLTSIASPLNLEGEAIYAASKSAVEKLTKIFSKELAPFNITVNAVGPTPIKTALIENISDEKLMTLLAKQTIKRMGTIEDLVSIVDFFLKKESDFITGQIIYMGGVS